MDKQAALETWMAQSYHLREMAHTEGWGVYAGMLRAVQAEQIERLMTEWDHSHQNFIRGYVAGLRRAAGLPQEVIDNTERAKGK